MKGEPEAGYYDPVEIERRARWVAEWETSPGLGRVVRNCAACGGEWEFGSQTQCDCGSNIFTERPIPAEPITGFDRLKGWLVHKPETPPERVPDAAVRAAAVRLTALADLIVESVKQLNEELSRSVNEENRPVEYGALQAAMAEAASEAGDVRPADVGRLAQTLRSLQLTLKPIINAQELTKK